MKTYVVTPQQKRHDETVLKMGHKICFSEEIWLIIPKLFLLPLLIWSTVSTLLRYPFFLTNLWQIWEDNFPNTVQTGLWLFLVSFLPVGNKVFYSHGSPKVIQ